MGSLSIVDRSSHTGGRTHRGQGETLSFGSCSPLWDPPEGYGVCPRGRVPHSTGCRMLTAGLVVSSPQPPKATAATLQNGQQGTCLRPEPGGTAEDRETIRCRPGANPDPVDHHPVPQGCGSAPAWARELPELAQGWHGESRVLRESESGLGLGERGCSGRARVGWAWGSGDGLS